MKDLWPSIAALVVVVAAGTYQFCVQDVYYWTEKANPALGGKSFGSRCIVHNNSIKKLATVSVTVEIECQNGQIGYPTSPSSCPAPGSPEIRSDIPAEWSKQNLSPQRVELTAIAKDGLSPNSQFTIFVNSPNADPVSWTPRGEGGSPIPSKAERAFINRMGDSHFAIPILLSVLAFTSTAWFLQWRKRVKADNESNRETLRAEQAEWEANEARQHAEEIKHRAEKAEEQTEAAKQQLNFAEKQVAEAREKEREAAYQLSMERRLQRPDFMPVAMRILQEWMGQSQSLNPDLTGLPDLRDPKPASLPSPPHMPEISQIPPSQQPGKKTKRGRRNDCLPKAEAVTGPAADREHPLRLLHLSDLHFNSTTSVMARLQALLDDLRHGQGWGRPGIEALDYLVISGDFTDRGSVEGWGRAYEFVSALTKELSLSAERCVFVPGNHDVKDMTEAFEERESSDGQKVTVQSSQYPLRFKAFSDSFYDKCLQRPYPADYAAQGVAVSFWETGLQFITLNSCWQIDQFNRKRAGVHPDAVANALRNAQKQQSEALESGHLMGPLLRIAVWHHAVAGPEQMKSVDFLGLLQNGAVKIALHGDVHEIRRGQNEPWRKDRPMFIAGAGAFGAPGVDRPESTPRLYNLVEIARDLKSARVHTRQQLKPDGPWKPWNEWPGRDGDEGGLPYYDLSW